jgi:glycosyltransferase involved in cell wall biosynthesis
MKIAMLGWELPPHNSGGMGVACFHLAKALADQGACIDFVIPYQADHPDVDFMTVHSTSSYGPVAHTAMGAYASLPAEADDDQPPLVGLRYLQHRYRRYVERHIERLNPDVIHMHDWLTFEAGMEAKRRTGKPLIAHVHATEFDRSGTNQGNPLIHEIEYNGLMMADRILAVSNITKQILVERYQIPADKIEVVYNSIDPAILAEKAVQIDNYLYARTLQQEGYIVVATLGRLTIQKGLVHFLRAAAKASQRIDRLVYLVAGDGEQRDELVQLSADLGIADSVLFTGFVRGQRWRDIYEVADVFVMSSVSEPFGLTALEAAAHRTALVLSKQSGVGEVLDNVLRYDYWDTDRLADQLVNLASSLSLRQELGDNVAHEFGRFSWHDAAERCMRHYRQLGVAA